MTAINTIVNETGITIYSDGACYNDEGVCCHFAQKVECLMNIPAIIASRGSGIPGATIKLEASVMCHTFDDLVEQMPELVRRHSLDAYCQRGDPVNLIVTTGGWSERDQEYQAYVTWIFAKEEDSLDEIEAKTERVPEYRIEPPPNWDLTRECGLFVDNTLSLGSDEDWIKFMECQRGTAYVLGPICPDKTGSIVGGFIQKTFFQREFSATHIIHRWPDKIGEPINDGAELRYEEPQHDENAAEAETAA